MPKKGQRVAENKREVVRRREQVAALLVSCVPVRQIAEQLKTPLRTVERDVTVIYAALRLRTQELAKTALDRTLAVLEQDEATMRTKVAQLDAGAKGVTPATAGARARCMEVLLKIHERRMRLLGLDVTKHEHRVGGLPAVDGEPAPPPVLVQLVWPAGEQQGAAPLTGGSASP